MLLTELLEKLEICPIIAAVHSELFSEAISSPTEVVFLLEGDIAGVGENIRLAHQNGKTIFLHIDLMKGIGKDRQGVDFLKMLGADGIISTRAALVKAAKELGLLAIQRCFALDSQGLYSIEEMMNSTSPDLMEIMPGVRSKVVERFSKKNTPVISGGLIETKAEVTAALAAGAAAVSTGKKELWYI